MAVDLPTAVLAFIAALESVSGVPIAILDRIDNTERFWARSAAILCEKTEDPFCDRDVRFMTSNTEPMGQSHIIEYKVGNGPVERVCAIIPPIPNIDPSFVAEAFGRPHPGLSQVPASVEAASWLMLYHASHCLDVALSDAEEDRAVALASLGLTLLDGHPRFTAGVHRSPARMMAVMTGREAAYWAAGTGERILLDLWKDETAEDLRSQFGCYAMVRTSTSIDIENIRLANSIGQNDTCAAREGLPVSASPQASISDANLWLWMYGQGGAQAVSVGAPPQPYTPMKTFANMETAAAYVLSTANILAD